MFPREKKMSFCSQSCHFCSLCYVIYLKFSQDQAHLRSNETAKYQPALYVKLSRSLVKNSQTSAHLSYTKNSFLFLVEELSGKELVLVLPEHLVTINVRHQMYMSSFRQCLISVVFMVKRRLFVNCFFFGEFGFFKNFSSTEHCYLKKETL